MQTANSRSGTSRASSPPIDSALNLGIRVAVIQMPLPIHAQARPAAIVALCADAAGAFRGVHQFLMSTSTWRTDTAWTRFADDASYRSVENFADSTLSRRVSLFLSHTSPRPVYAVDIN